MNHVCKNTRLIPIVQVSDAKKLVFFILFVIEFGQHEVENHCQQEHHCHAVLGKYGAYDFGEDAEHACCLSEAKPHAE